MSTSHLTPVAVSAIVGGKTAFSVGCVCDGKQSSGKESRSIHGKNLAPPRQQSCRTVRSNRGKNLSVQTRSIARPASIDVQNRFVIARPTIFLLCSCLAVVPSSRLRDGPINKHSHGPSACLKRAICGLMHRSNGVAIRSPRRRWRDGDPHCLGGLEVDQKPIREVDAD